MGIITRGYTDNTIITRGFGYATQFLRIVKREILRLKSFIFRRLMLRS